MTIMIDAGRPADGTRHCTTMGCDNRAKFVGMALDEGHGDRVLQVREMCQGCADGARERVVELVAATESWKPEFERLQRFAASRGDEVRRLQTQVEALQRDLLNDRSEAIRLVGERDTADRRAASILVDLQAAQGRIEQLKDRELQLVRERNAAQDLLAARERRDQGLPPGPTPAQRAAFEDWSHRLFSSPVTLQAHQHTWVVTKWCGPNATLNGRVLPAPYWAAERICVCGMSEQRLAPGAPWGLPTQAEPERGGY